MGVFRENGTCMGKKKHGDDPYVCLLASLLLQ